MGTNFYVGELHIGKRSAAGRYCWDCNITLCKTGEANIHMGSGADHFYEACPRCGQAPVKESFEDSSVGRELGFNTSEPVGKQGVRGCSSFSWAATQDELRTALQDAPIVDEYGREYDDLDAVLSECPVQFFDSIGVDFS